MMIPLDHADVENRCIIFDQTGRVVGRFHAGSAVTKLAPATREPGQESRILAATRDGRLIAVQW